MQHLRPLILAAAVAFAIILAITLPTDSSTQTVQTPVHSGTSTLSVESVQQHASASDCWTIIEGNVYNITSYIPHHPGGRAEITRACGIDATALFTTRAGRVHSQNAHDILSGFYIGTLGGKMNITNSTYHPQYEDDEDEDDDD